MNSIIIGGGCFWGVEGYFQKLIGVVETRVGYVNGFTENPNYEQVCTGETGYVEAVKVDYNENEISLAKILEHLFRIIDPTIKNRQGNDVGTQYQAGVYYNTQEELEIIEEFISKEQEKYNEKIVVTIEKLSNFWLAEEYHQNYLIKNPTGYCHINMNLIKKEEMK